MIVWADKESPAVCLKAPELGITARGDVSTAEPLAEIWGATVEVIPLPYDSW
jgi:hypothetical protein